MRIILIILVLGGCAFAYQPECDTKCYGSDDVSVQVSETLDPGHNLKQGAN
jgi:hypothetical protein